MGGKWPGLPGHHRESTLSFGPFSEYFTNALRRTLHVSCWNDISVKFWEWIGWRTNIHNYSLPGGPRPCSAVTKGPVFSSQPTSQHLLWLHSSWSSRYLYLQHRQPTLYKPHHWHLPVQPHLHPASELTWVSEQVWYNQPTFLHPFPGQSAEWGKTRVCTN